MKRYSQKGFTLVELLMVIAVIGLLASIVFVAVSGTTDRARIARGLQFSHSLQNTLGAYAVGIWRFDEGTGITAFDASGWGNDGALVAGPAWRCASIDSGYTPSGQGCSLEFDGVDDRVDCGSGASLNPGNEITNEAWFKLDTLSGTLTILSKDNPGPTNYWMDARTNGTSIYVGGYTAASGACYNGVSVSLEMDIWYHLAWTYNRLRMKTYLNGILISDVSKTCVLNANTAPVRIGTRNGSGGQFDGIIDEVRIYSAALTTAQIEANYYAGLDRLLAKNLINEQEYQRRLAKI